MVGEGTKSDSTVVVVDQRAVRKRIETSEECFEIMSSGVKSSLHRASFDGDSGGDGGGGALWGERIMSVHVCQSTEAILHHRPLTEAISPPRGRRERMITFILVVCAG